MEPNRTNDDVCLPTTSASTEVRVRAQERHRKRAQPLGNELAHVGGEGTKEETRAEDGEQV